MTRGSNIIHMSSVPRNLNQRRLDQPLHCPWWEGYPKTIPESFIWNGSSSGWFFSRIFPRWRHPIASCRHDFRCMLAETPEQRAWSDKQFFYDVARTVELDRKARRRAKIEACIGYIGVRIGAFFGIGVNYPHWSGPLKKVFKRCA